MIELWRGNVNAWECDELGHYNVRFYLARLSEAVANLAEAAGLNPIHRTDASATLIMRDIHVRFLAEAHPGAPLYIEGGLIEHDDCTARAIFVMRHAGSGKPAASYHVVLGHASPQTTLDFPWPKRFHAHADTLKVDLPDFSAPRGLSLDATPSTPSLAQADKLGLESIGRGRFGQSEMDGFGSMRAEFLLGRVSDSVTNFSAAFPEEWEQHASGKPGNVASALLECRILPRHWPRCGDGYVIRSGLKSVSPKVRNIVHWVMEPATGKVWWTMEGVAAPMDLTARKLLDVPDAVQAKVKAACIDGLSA
ncbi:thioesterase family protein [Maricaulis parjimensis]|uniref:thioesterase family protein n=1 Tax=Maricaulis parjimensis TaxID=144023 RepID=UPI0019398DCE|nr:thioesterase family protein [Maricaulis parjimensis]